MGKANNKSLAYKKFEKLCKKNKVTPATISKETGISTASFSQWKNGEYNFKIEKLMLIAKFFNVSITEFIE